MEPDDKAPAQQTTAEEDAQPAVAEQATPKPTKRPLLWAALVVGLLAIAAALYFFVPRPAGKKPAATGTLADITLQLSGTPVARYYSNSGDTSTPTEGRDVFFILPDGSRLDFPEGTLQGGVSNNYSEYFYILYDGEQLNLFLAPVNGKAEELLHSGNIYPLNTSPLQNAFLFADKEENEEGVRLYRYYEGEVAMLAQGVENMLAYSQMAVGAAYSLDGTTISLSGLETQQWQADTRLDELCTLLVSNSGNTVYFVKEDAGREAGSYDMPFIVTVETAGGQSVDIPVMAEVSHLFGAISYKINFYLNASGDEALVAARDGLWLYRNGTAEKISEGDCRFTANTDSYGSSLLREYYSTYSYPMESFEDFYFYRNDSAGQGLYLYEGGGVSKVQEDISYAPRASEDLRQVLATNGDAVVLVQRDSTGTFTSTTITEDYSNYSLQGSAVYIEKLERYSADDYLRNVYLWREGALSEIALGTKYSTYNPDANAAAYISNFDETRWVGELYVWEEGKESLLVSQQCSLVCDVRDDGSVYFFENATEDEENLRMKTGDMFCWKDGKITLVEENATLFWSQY